MPKYLTAIIVLFVVGWLVLALLYTRQGTWAVVHTGTIKKVEYLAEVWNSTPEMVLYFDDNVSFTIGRLSTVRCGVPMILYRHRRSYVGGITYDLVYDEEPNERPVP